MKTLYSILLAIAICVLLFFGVCATAWYSHFSFSVEIAKQPTVDEVVENFGIPNLEISALSELEYDGWTRPRIVPIETSKIFIYENFFGWRYYLFIDNNNKVFAYFLGST